MSAPVSFKLRCPRCGSSRWVVQGYGTLTANNWLCRRCLARIRAWDRTRMKRAA
jgi:transposase-like protein